MNKKEMIICAAVWCPSIEGVHNPKNIKSGLVVAGLRHCNCLEALYKIDKNASRNQENIDGFITSENRFINREEAFILAKENGQFIGTAHGDILYSENLY